MFEIFKNVIMLSSADVFIDFCNTDSFENCFKSSNEIFFRNNVYYFYF